MTAEPATVRERHLEEIITGFRDAWRELRCLGTERLVREGISMAHFHVLSVLEGHGPTSMGKLADVIGVSLSNATGLVDRMSERGLVERFRTPGDRRVVVVRISDHGRQTLHQSELLRHDLLSTVLGHLDDERLERLAAASADLRDAVERHAGAAAESTHHRHDHPPAGTDADRSTTTTPPTAPAPA
jgi:DNA-binding MarR family transcriptional regulator